MSKKGCPSHHLTKLFCGKRVFSYAAKGADEIIGKVLEFGAGSNTVIRIAERFVIGVATDVAYVFFHNNRSPFIFKILFLLSNNTVYVILYEDEDSEGIFIEGDGQLYCRTACVGFDKVFRIIIPILIVIQNNGQFY